jgi:hypothetical protein
MEIPGVDRVAPTIIAELGIDMRHRHLESAEAIPRAQAENACLRAKGNVPLR